MLYRSISDGTVSYTYFNLLYCGKPRKEGSQFYITGTDENTINLVKNLSKNVDLNGRNIPIDRYFTSISFAKHILAKNITVVGTLRANRKGIHKELVDMKKR